MAYFQNYNRPQGDQQGFPQAPQGVPQGMPQAMPQGMPQQPGQFQFPNWDFSQGKNLAVNLKNTTGGFTQGIINPMAQGYAQRIPGYFNALDQYANWMDPANIPSQVANVRAQLGQEASRQGAVQGAQAAQSTGNPYMRQAFELDRRNQATQAGNRYLSQQYSPEAMASRFGSMMNAYNPSMLTSLYQVPLGYQPQQQQQGGSMWDTAASLGMAAAAF